MPRSARIALATVVALALVAPAARAGHSPIQQAIRTAQSVLLPAAVGTQAGAPQRARSTPPGCSARSKSEANATDAISGNQTQIVYFVPKGQPDQCLDQTALVNSMNSLNAFFKAQGLGTLRIDRTSTGAMDIPFIRGKETENAYTGVISIAEELRTIPGFVKSNKRYIIFAAVDQGGICGEAEWPGSFAAFFLDSVVGCGTRDFGNGTLAGAGAAEVIAGQEILHNEGVVSLAAPNGCQVSIAHYAHVCAPGGVLVEMGRLDPESRDIMFPYALPGMKLSEKVLDRNRDDYFKVRGIFDTMVIDLEDSKFFDKP